MDWWVRRWPPGRSRTGPTTLGALLLGAACAVWFRPQLESSDGSVRLWVADRDGDRLVGLGPDLFVERVLPWPAPVALEPARSGQLWVAWSPRGDPAGRHRISRLDPERGRELASWEVGSLIDLAAMADGGVVWLERGAGGAAGRPAGGPAGGLAGGLDREPDRGPVLLGRVSGAGRRCSLAAPPGATCLAPGPRGLVLGTDAGRLWRFDGGWRAGRRVGAAALDLGCKDGRWWALASAGRGGGSIAVGAPRVPGEPPVVVRLPPSGPGGGGALALGTSAAWAAGGRTAWSLVGDEPGRAVPLYLAGVEAAAVASNGELLFALPGAVLRKSAAGAALPGQGGFEYLVDLVLVDT